MGLLFTALIGTLKKDVYNKYILYFYFCFNRNNYLYICLLVVFYAYYTI